MDHGAPIEDGREGRKPRAVLSSCCRLSISSSSVRHRSVCLSEVEFYLKTRFQ